MRLLLLGALAVVGCAPTPTSAPTDPAGVWVVVSGAESMYGVAWLDKASLVLSRGTETGARLFVVDPTNGTATQFGEPPKSPACDGTDELAPSSSDRGLEWYRVCKHAPDPTQYSLMRRSPDGSITTERTFTTMFPVGGFTFDGTDWIADYGSRICNTIIRFTMAGLELIHVTVEGPDGGFDTGGDVRDECERMGVSRTPAVRAGTLVFAASTASIGKSGAARLRQPSDIYVASVTGGRAERIALGLVDPGDILWVDDDHVVVSGERPAGTPGTWLVDRVSGDVRAVLPFAARSMSISPDGIEVVAMRSVGGSLPADEVVVFPASLLAP